MKKEFVPYDRALKLKELGFDEPCIATHGYLELYINTDDGHLKAPLYQQAFRWFREEHQLDTSNNIVYSKFNDTISKKYSGVLRDKSVFTNIGFYDTYEEAELACLDKLIQIVESKQSK